MKWTRRSTTIVPNSKDVGKSGVYDGVVLLAKLGPVTDAERNAVRTATAKKVPVATRERGERRETPQRKWPLEHPAPSCYGREEEVSHQTRNTKADLGD